MPRPSIARAMPFVIILAACALAACSKKEEAPPTAAATPEPAPTAAAPVVHPKDSHAFTIGLLQAFALRDGGMEVPNDNKVFAVGRTPDEVAAVLGANGVPTDKLALSIQPLLVKTTDRVLLFDTGASSNFGPGSGMLPGSLAEAGIEPASVTDIFISHLHGDHVGGLVNAEGALFFPNATIHISRPEWNYMTTVDAEMAKKVGLGNRDVLVAAMKPKVDAFTPGAELVPGVVTAVDIKGHTPGHSGYRVASGQDSLLYVGDSMHHYIVSVQKPDWTIAFDGDNKTAEASRAALIADAAAKGQRVYAVHFPYPGIGRFEKKGDGYAWVAE
jgi:glyoxylase-like metal-dependent hydrolase (beta-lactamase superfamily II)